VSITPAPPPPAPPPPPPPPPPAAPPPPPPPGAPATPPAPPLTPSPHPSAPGPLPRRPPQCHYPGNYASNKRWCCGDMYHMDISLWAFEKLADLKWGVIGMEWRDVSCSYKPALQARSPFGRTSMPDNYKPRPGEAHRAGCAPRPLSGPSALP
jgi:hypothetical protein